MTEVEIERIHDRLEAAFPDATRTFVDWIDYGSALGLAVQFGKYPSISRQAVRLPLDGITTAKIDKAVSALRSWANEKIRSK